MLGHKIIVQSQRLARLGLGNRSVLKEGVSGVSPFVTSDPQNQNKQARVWAGGILSANFKTSSTPDAPLANVKFIEEEEDPYDGLIEDLVAGEHEFEPDRSRELSQTVEYYQHTLPSDDVIDQSVPLTLNIQQNGLAASSDSIPSSVHTTAMEQVESYDCRGSVSLHSVMQSMVPEPYQPSSTAPTHVNMPGGGHQMTLKYLNDRELHSHQSRHHSTSAAYRMQNRRNFSTYRILNVSIFNDMQGVQGDIESLRKELGGPSPQGIQGENDARFALWMKNCGQFGDCSEQLDAVRSGRKTLQQIFDEQDEQIRLAAEKLEMSMPEQSRN